MEYFGKVVDCYQTSHLRELVYGGKIEDAKKYVLSYFLKIGGSGGKSRYVLYDPIIERSDEITREAISGLIILDKSELKTSYIKPFKNGDFDIQKWFFFDIDDLFSIDIDITQPRIYKDGNKLKINFCNGFIHQTHLKYEEYDKNTKSCVELMLNHIKEVLVSNNEEQYDYYINWISKLCVGKKLQTAIYNRGEGGTGKSTLTEFLRKYVIGARVVLRSSDANHFTGRFNEIISGKLLNIIEEFPKLGSFEAKTAMSKLKTFITESTMTFEQKNEAQYQAPNMTSFIINSNENVLQEDRRIAIFDISSVHINDEKYFDAIVGRCYNMKVGEAFYAYMVERYEQIKDTFKESKLVESISKAINRNGNLHPFFQYLKEAYLVPYKDIKMTYKCLNEQFADSNFGRMMKTGELPRGKLRQLLLQIGIEINSTSHHAMMVKCTHHQLRDIYVKRRWIDELDEFVDKYDKTQLLGGGGKKIDKYDKFEEAFEKAKIEPPKRVVPHRSRVVEKEFPDDVFDDSPFDKSKTTTMDNILKCIGADKALERLDNVSKEVEARRKVTDEILHKDKMIPPQVSNGKFIFKMT